MNGCEPARRAVRRARAPVLLLAALLSGACSSPGTAPALQRGGGFDVRQLAKTDINRVAETHQMHVLAGVRRLTEKLYRRNPGEWRKSDTGSMEASVSRIFERKHRWRFASLGYRRDIDAMHIALHPDYRGDRVQALAVGLASMVQAALGDRESFYMLDDLEPQHLYNAARNVEIVAWKLANARDREGRLLLLSNEMGEVSNLSFEREFGRIIGLLDVLADIVEEETDRTVARVVQNLATAVFLPVY